MSFSVASAYREPRSKIVTKHNQRRCGGLTYCRVVNARKEWAGFKRTFDNIDIELLLITDKTTQLFFGKGLAVF